jgi:PHD/YefM family antitoxin component YafN of YafNO toxin-antitoxin module
MLQSETRDKLAETIKKLNKPKLRLDITNLD